MPVDPLQPPTSDDLAAWRAFQRGDLDAAQANYTEYLAITCETLCLITRAAP
jgi:hypothetical protein